MDKSEYGAKLDEINELVDRQDYKGALRIVDDIDWRRVRSARTLCMAGEIYEANKRYEDSRRLLLLAHQRAPIGRTVLYRLVELSVKMGKLDDAADYYKQFVDLSPNDNSRYILKYKIYRARRSSIEEQISILQEYKAKEYTERWAYELARLYARAGMKEACIEECDDLILWFSEGRYVTKAMELKMKYAPLTPVQQEKYDKRYTSRPSVTAEAAAGAVTAATEAAAKIVGNTKAGVFSYKPRTPDSGDKELEALLESIAEKEKESAQTPQAPVFAPEPKDEGELQEKAVQNLRDVLSVGQPEAAAAREPEAGKIPEEKKDYLVKDLEPDDLTKTAEFKPFRFGKTMTMEVKAEAPRSEAMQPGENAEESFKSDISAQDFDLEALLAETASELAQAVAEDGEDYTAPETAEDSGEEPEATENIQDASEEQEIQEEAPENQQTEEIPEEAAEVQETEEMPEEEAEVQETEEMPEESAEAEEIEESFDNAVEDTPEAEIIPETAEESSQISQEDGNPDEEITEAEEELPGQDSNVSGLVAPAAARAAIVAAGVAQAVAAKAEEIEALTSGSAKEETMPEEAVSEPLAEEADPEDSETDALQEDFLEEEAAESETEEAAYEEPAKESDAAPAEDDLEAEEELLTEEDFSQELEAAMQEEMIGDAPSDTEEDTEETPELSEEEPKMKYVAAAEEENRNHAFNSAVQGLMRHYLTEEELRRLFTYFVPVPGMNQQIHEALDIAQESACAKTSQTGNIIVTGREGSGKTRLSEGLIKALCKERQMEGAKVAYLDAQKLNDKDPVTVVGKLSGGFLVVEHAASLTPETIEALSKAMEFKTNRLTVILEDLRQGIEELTAQYPDFMKKFDSRIGIPVFTNDELVSFAKTYAKELGYKIDDMAVLALYTLIGDNQDEDEPVTIGSVREMMDNAIKKASKKGRRTGKKVAKRHLDESGRIMLYEKDFDI